MAKHGRGIAFVIVGAAVLAAAAAVVYLFVIAPKAQQSKMQDEVRGFAERWQALRTCFYGDKARANDPVDAVVIRELVDPQLATEIAVCEESLREARRPEGPTTGIERVEHAWSEMKKARRDLAKALAIRLQVPPPRPVPQLRAALGEAAVKAEAAYQALRAAAGLEPDPLAGQPVRDAELEPIAVEGKPALHIRVAANQILAAARDGDAVLFALLDGSDKTEVHRAPDKFDVMPPGGGWVARRADDGIVAVELAAPPDGAEPRTVSVGAGQAMAALETGKVRLIAARREGKAVLYRSTDGGASWREQVIEGADRVAIESAPIEGRLIVSYYDRRYEIGGDELVASSRPVYASGCFGETVSWWLTSRGVVAGGIDDGLVKVANSEEMPWLARACTDTQVLGVGPFDSEIDLPATRLRLCERKDCRVSASLPRAYGAKLAAGIGPLTGPLVAFASDGIALLWAGTKKGSGLVPRSWMRLPEGAELVGLVEWKGQVRAVLELDGGDRGDDSFALASF